MGYHTFDASKAAKLEDAASRFRYCSAEELLGALDMDPDAVVADLGSGTGFYTDIVAPRAETVYAIDVQEAMHDYYRGKGLPENVEPITAGVADLPLAANELDGAFSTMTYHEFAASAALDELARVITTGGRLVLVDWSGNGPGEAGPPVDERYTSDEARERLTAHGFTIERAEERRETFVVVGIHEQ